MLVAGDKSAAVHEQQHGPRQAAGRRLKHVQQVARVGTVSLVAGHLHALVRLPFVLRAVQLRRAFDGGRSDFIAEGADFGRHGEDIQ